MLPAKIEVVVGEELIREEVNKQVSKYLTNHYLFVDANKIAELCCLSVKYLEEHLFNDPRMLAIQVRKSRKRLWKADKAFEVINEIIQQW